MSMTKEFERILRYKKFFSEKYNLEVKLVSAVLSAAVFKCFPPEWDASFEPSDSDHTILVNFRIPKLIKEILEDDPCSDAMKRQSEHYLIDEIFKRGLTSMASDILKETTGQSLDGLIDKLNSDPDFQVLMKKLEDIGE